MCSVPLNLLNVQLSSQLIHVLPHAAQSGPRRPAVLPVPRLCLYIGVPVRLLNGWVPPHIASALVLFGLRVNLVQVMLVYT